jgi:hypothetical protein
MMVKLGFKPGDALGKCVTTNSAGDKEESSTTAAGNWVRSRTEPLNLVLKEDRGGIGLDSEKKRKFREEAQTIAKRKKAEEGEYRDRMKLEREERRADAQVHAAQKIAEKLDATEEGEAEAADTSISEICAEFEKTDRCPGEKQAEPRKRVRIKPLSKINVLYRGLIRDREERELSLLSRHVLETSLPSSFFPNPQLPGYEDPTLDGDDEHALGRSSLPLSFVEQEDQEKDDPELDEFNALSPQERLRRLVGYLRERHQYCFWCKYRYETDEMEGCPGLTEEDHD